MDQQGDRSQEVESIGLPPERVEPRAQVNRSIRLATSYLLLPVTTFAFVCASHISGIKRLRACSSAQRFHPEPC